MSILPQVSVVLFSILYCFLLHLLSLGYNAVLHAKIDIGRGDVAQCFMIALVVVIFDKGFYGLPEL